MTDGATEKQGNESKTAQPDRDKNSCPSCGHDMKKKMFRTGSVSKPGWDMNVCTSCGTRQ